MLIGIVLSIPFLVFSVYTVLTVYIDENGYMSPSSAFVKIHSNRKSKNVPALTMEDLLNESSAVMKEKPDIVLKIPGIFNKAFELDKPQPENLDTDESQTKILEIEKPQNLNFDIDKVINRLMKGVNQLLGNSRTASEVPGFIIPLFSTNATVNGTSSNNETKVTLMETQNSTLCDSNSTKVTTSKPELEEQNSTVTTPPLIEKNSIDTTSKTQLLENNSTETTAKTPLLENNSTETTAKTPLLENSSIVTTLVSTKTTSTELNSTMTTSKIPPVGLDSTARTPETPIAEKNFTRPEITTPAVTNSNRNESRIPSSVNNAIKYIMEIATFPLRKIMDFLKYIRSKVTGRKVNIDAEFIRRQEVRFQRQQIKLKSEISQNHSIVTNETFNFSEKDPPNRSNNHITNTTEPEEFVSKDSPNIAKGKEQGDHTLFPSIKPAVEKDTPNTSSNHAGSTTELNSFVEFGDKDTPNTSKDKSKDNFPLLPTNNTALERNSPNTFEDEKKKDLPQFPPDNAAVDVMEKSDTIFGLNKSEPKESTGIVSHYSFAVPLQATAPDDNGYSLFNILQGPTDYLAGFIGMLYSCALPANTSTTFYSVKDCPTCGSGSQDSSLRVTCAASYVPASSEMIVCHVGGWVVGKAKKPVKQLPGCKKHREFARCPQITRKPDPKWVGCAQRGYPVDCESPNITWYPGSELEILCPPSHRASFDVNLLKHKGESSVTQCDNSGKWSRNNVSCTPVCGVLGTQAEAAPLVMHGNTASPGYLPWVTALFLKDGNDLEYICSATIINSFAVVTAAHCVYSKEPGELFILAGSTELKKNENAFAKVSQIRIPFSYTDKQGNYGSDIAILLMASPFQFSDMVQPVCVDWEDKLDFSNQPMGKVAGWGVDQSFKEVLNLRYVDLPLVSVENCSEAVPVGFKKFFSYTSFCAGYTNGTGVCNGDSGAGFMLERDGQWYLAGTVSISPRQLNTEFCQPNSYALYTKIKLFIPWIKNEVDNPVPSSTTTANPNLIF